jgi:hypothetical protein
MVLVPKNLVLHQSSSHSAIAAHKKRAEWPLLAIQHKLFQHCCLSAPQQRISLVGSFHALHALKSRHPEHLGQIVQSKHTAPRGVHYPNQCHRLDYPLLAHIAEYIQYGSL